MSKEDAPNFREIKPCILCKHCILENNNYSPQHRCTKYNFIHLYFMAGNSTCDSWESK